MTTMTEHDMTIQLTNKIRCKIKDDDNNGEEKEPGDTYCKGKVIPVQAVEAPTFSDNRLIDGGKFVSPTRRPLFTPRRVLVLTFVRR
jgi:hypothetical protein